MGYQIHRFESEIQVLTCKFSRDTLSQQTGIMLFLKSSLKQIPRRNKFYQSGLNFELSPKTFS